MIDLRGMCGAECSSYCYISRIAQQVKQKPKRRAYRFARAVKESESDGSEEETDDSEVEIVDFEEETEVDEAISPKSFNFSFRNRLFGSRRCRMKFSF